MVKRHTLARKRDVGEREEGVRERKKVQERGRRCKREEKGARKRKKVRKEAREGGVAK